MFSRYYDFYKPGDYVLYRNLERFFEVRSLSSFFFFFIIKKKKKKKTTLCEPVGEYSMIIWQKMQQISTGISRAFALWCSNDLRQRPVTEPVVCYFHNYSITSIKVYDMFRTLDPLYKTLTHKLSFTRLLTKKYHSDNCENVHSILQKPMLYYMKNASKLAKNYIFSALRFQREPLCISKMNNCNIFFFTISINRHFYLRFIPAYGPAGAWVVTAA